MQTKSFWGGTRWLASDRQAPTQVHMMPTSTVLKEQDFHACRHTAAQCGLRQTPNTGVCSYYSFQMHKDMQSPANKLTSIDDQKVCYMREV